MGDDSDVSTHQPRRTNGQYASTSLEAVYAEIKRLDQLRAADQLAATAALSAAEKAVAAALTASKEAVNKAEASQQRTNEGQNEFRGQLKDQAATLLSRVEYDIGAREMAGDIERAFTEIGTLRSRLDVGPPSLGALQERSDRNEGHKAGVSDTQKLILGLLAAALAVAGFLAGQGGV